MKDKHVFGAIGAFALLVIVIIILSNALSKSQKRLEESEAKNALTLDKGQLGLTNVPSVVESKPDEETGE